MFNYWTEVIVQSDIKNTQNGQDHIELLDDLHCVPLQGLIIGCVTSFNFILVSYLMQHQFHKPFFIATVVTDYTTVKDGVLGSFIDTIKVLRLKCQIIHRREN